MFLHCAPPYRRDIPNPALGYLKGFLEAQGVHVHNVYWNLILDEEMQALENPVGNYHLIPSMYRTYVGPLYFIKKFCSAPHTTLDALFSLYTTKKEREKIVESVISKIDKTLNPMTDPIHGFTVKTHQWLMMHYIIQQLKNLNPETTIIVGGITNEKQGRTYMKIFDYIDYVVWGEGEYPLYQLVTDQDTLDNIPNILYRDKTSIKSTHSYIPSNLDMHPFADHTDYFATVQHMDTPPQVLLPIWGSRSCPWNKCKFCVVNEEYTYRTRSPQNIVKEMEYQTAKHCIDTFAFMDSDIAGNKKRFKQLLTCIVESAEKRGTPYHIYAEMSPLFITKETAPLMQKASFDLIQIGFEAVTDPLLKKMHKRHGMVHNIQALKLGAKYNLDVKGNVMGGIPPETRHDVQESVQNIVFLRFFLTQTPVMHRLFSLYKGSAFYDEMLKSELEEWNTDVLWEEIESTGIIPAHNRFDFFSFHSHQIRHYLLWDTFKRLLTLYNRIECSYTWEEYSNCSVYKEKGIKNYMCILDSNETNILIYCDTVKSFEQVYTEFPHISENDLYRKINRLKEEGLLYINDHKVISILDASKRKIHQKPFTYDNYTC
ncbi:MAG: radical SAM protein [Candidatus Methanofastidiosia archaeon]|jgi:hypothetical protein